MGLITRSTKAGGGTDFNTGQTIVVGTMNDDFNTVYTAVNGNLDSSNLAPNSVGNSELQNSAVTDAKVSASAAIQPSKFDQTPGSADGSTGMDADIVQSHAATDAEYNTRTDPLDSSATPSIPAHLEDELERLRFVLARLGPGVAARLTDGTNAAAWYDGVTIGPNLVPNGSWLDNSATPIGVTINGSPTVTPTALPVTEGHGKYLRFADAAGAVTDGPSWTINGVRGNTLYLIEVRALNTTAEVNLATDHATGTFGNLDLDTNSTDAHPESVATDWQTLAGVIETDASGTGIDINVTPSATNYDFGVAYVAMYELSSSRDAEGTGREHKGARGGNIVQTATSTSTSAATMRSDTTLTFVVPGDNYQAIVHGVIESAGTSTPNTYQLDENTDVDGVGSYSSVSSVTKTTTTGQLFVPLHYASGVLTAGNTYGYRLDGSDLGNEHRIVVQLVRMN